MRLWTPGGLVHLSFHHCVFILAVWESGNGHLGAPCLPWGCLTKRLSPATPGHFTWGDPGVFSAEGVGPLLWGQDLVYFLRCLLPAAEKQERVITFEFLPFAFTSLPPPQRSSLKTDSVYNAVGVFVYRCRSLEEDSRVRCLLLGVFIILTLTMVAKRDIGLCVRLRETGSHTAAWNSLCRPGWFHIYSNLPASACWILGLQVWPTMPSNRQTLWIIKQCASNSGKQEKKYIICNFITHGHHC